MTRARDTIVSTQDTPYYHVVSRCVRRTYLCGKDYKTGQDYEHRRIWIADRIRLLSSIFSIDICSYAVMSNHYHLVVKIDPETSDNWDNDTVIKHWTTLFKGSQLIRRYKNGETLDSDERHTINATVDKWRSRLSNLSWFMKCLNEPIARQANSEDNCTGHFWESRFKSEALLTEEALLTCMAYVDLNPIRADIAKTPEDSDYTSIQERIFPTFNLSKAIGHNLKQGGCEKFELSLKPLAQFEGNIASGFQKGILFDLTEYIELVDWTGRIVRDDKRGSISNALPPILNRLAISVEEWQINTQQFEKHYQAKFSRHRQFQNAA